MFFFHYTIGKIISILIVYSEKILNCASLFRAATYLIQQPVIMPALLRSAASLYSGYEVDDDWCVSVLQSYKAERDVLFPWSVGKS